MTAEYLGCSQIGQSDWAAIKPLRSFPPHRTPTETVPTAAGTRARGHSKRWTFSNLDFPLSNKVPKVGGESFPLSPNTAFLTGMGASFHLDFVTTLGYLSALPGRLRKPIREHPIRNRPHPGPESCISQRDPQPLSHIGDSSSRSYSAEDSTDRERRKGEFDNANCNSAREAAAGDGGECGLGGAAAAAAALRECTGSGGDQQQQKQRILLTEPECGAHRHRHHPHTAAARACAKRRGGCEPPPTSRRQPHPALAMPDGRDRTTGQPQSARERLFSVSGWLLCALSCRIGSYFLIGCSVDAG